MPGMPPDRVTCPTCRTQVAVRADGTLRRHRRDGETCPGGEDVQTLALPWSTPPLSLNDRKHWAVKGRITKEIRTTVALLARNARLAPVEHAYVTLHYRPRDDRPRDKDNLVGTVKPVIDGLKDYGLVLDDSSAYVTPMPSVIHKAVRGMPGCMWLTVATSPISEEDR